MLKMVFVSFAYISVPYSSLFVSQDRQRIYVFSPAFMSEDNIVSSDL